MNILIVNGFGKSEKQIEKYNLFCRLIDELFHIISYKSGIDKFFYTYKTIDELHEFVFNLPDNDKLSEFEKKIIHKNFMKMDFIFVDGKEKNYLPWNPQGQKLLYLIKLCEKYEKVLFAAGIGFLHLIFNFATNNQNKNFINSNGDYPTIEDLKNLPNDVVKNLKRADVFLDFATGDIYEYKSSKQWEPIYNIGLHKLLYAEKFKERGKYVLKEFKFSKNKDLVSSVKKDIKINILKQYCNHWIVKDIPVEFVAFSSLTWYQHNFCVNNKKLQYKILSDSNFGAMMIEHLNSIGVFFHIQKSFPDTITIIKNFIKTKFREIHLKNSSFIVNKKKLEPFESEEAMKLFASVVRDPPRDYDSGINYLCTNPKSTENLVNKSRFYFNLINTEKEGKHVGMSYNNKDMIFVKNNSVIQNNLSLENNKKNYLSDIYRPEKLSSEEILKHDYDNIRHDPYWDDDKIIEFYKQKKREICKVLSNNDTFDYNAQTKLTKKTNYNKTKNSLSSTRHTTRPKSAYSNKMNNNNTNLSSVVSLKKNIKNKILNNSVAINDSNNKIIKNNYSVNNSLFHNENNNKTENVITMLFPYINPDDFDIKKNDDLKIEKKVEIIKLNQEKRIKSNFNRKFKKYDKELNTFRDKPSIRCSSAYITEQEQKRKDDIESKKYWMCPEDFKRVFGKRTLNKKDKEEQNRTNQLYPKSDVYTSSVLGYQFRELDKSKWVCKKNFVV